jgi:hypothetical protein
LSTDTSLRAACTEAGAEPSESSTRTWSFLPRTPPSELILSTASLMPRCWSLPIVALEPVSGTTAPIVKVPLSLGLAAA